MIKQDINIKNCGQCCLATILNITIEESINLIGHNNSTKSKELTKHFKNNGNKKGIPSNNGLCILRFNNIKNWHWILKINNNIYDPLIGELIDIKEYFKINYKYRITSHFEII